MRVQVQPFGSFVSGLGTPDSDLDVVITGVREPWNPQLGFYSREERPAVAALLDKCVCSSHRAYSLQ